MIIDKNGKLFGKLNIIDLAVILAVIAVMIGVVVRFSGGASSIVSETKQIQYVVKVSGIREYTVNALAKKGLVTDKKFTANVGEITNIETTPAVHESATASGELVKTSLPDRYDCLVTITCEGKESKSGYFNSNNEDIAVGRDYTIYSKYTTTSGIITDIDVIQ